MKTSKVILLADFTIAILLAVAVTTGAYRKRCALGDGYCYFEKSNDQKVKK